MMINFKKSILALDVFEDALEVFSRILKNRYYIIRTIIILLFRLIIVVHEPVRKLHDCPVDQQYGVFSRLPVHHRLLLGRLTGDQIDEFGARHSCILAHVHDRLLNHVHCYFLCRLFGNSCIYYNRHCQGQTTYTKNRNSTTSFDAVSCRALKRL
jgi:hypothetical protein